MAPRGGVETASVSGEMRWRWLEEGGREGGGEGRSLNQASSGRASNGSGSARATTSDMRSYLSLALALAD